MGLPRPCLYTFRRAHLPRSDADIKLDPGFKTFFDWSKSVDVPVVIVSSGMVPIIRAIFENLVGKEDAERIQVVSNDVDLSKGGGKGQWTVKFRHPESCVASPHPVAPSTSS